MVRSFLPKFSSRSERRLLALCKNNPDDDPDVKNWNKNAVQYLVKKLKKNLDIIDELEKAISSECANTRCVPLPKTPDNRLLVSHRRGLPQVIYCRLWRWPDLQSHHQIRAISTCEGNSDQNPSSERSNRSQTVCVNPFHYERNKPVSLEPVLVPCSSIPPDLSTSCEDSEPTGGTKAIPNRARLPNTIAGATVRSILESDQQRIVSSDSELVGDLSNQEPTVTGPSLRILVKPSTSNTLNMAEQQDNNNINLPQQFGPNLPHQGQEDGEVYMSYDEREQPTYMQPHEDPASYDYSRPMPVISGEPTPQDYNQQLYTEAHSQLFLSDQQQQSQQQMHQSQHLQQQQHIHQSIHEQQQQHHHQPQQQPQRIPVSLPIQTHALPQSQQQQQQPQQQIPIHSQQQLPTPHQQMPPPNQPAQRLLSQHIHQQQIQQPQQIIMRQAEQPSHQHPHHTNLSQQNQQQYHPQPTSSQQPQGTMLGQSTEIAHPYQFKQNKFSPLARAMHDSRSVGSSTIGQQQNQCYDARGYITRAYPYNQSQQQQQQQQMQVPYSQYQHQHQTQQSGMSPSYSIHTQHAQYPPHPPPSYATIYPQQESYPGLEQMQLDYQQEMPMALGPQQQQSVYYDASPMPGPSHLPDSSMQLQQQQQAVPTIDFQEVPYSEGASWCSISYHEYDQRVGEKYQPTSFAVSVDGFTHPACSDRYCIGGLSNVNRNEFTEWVRRRIGKGVKFTYVDGEVYVECLCDASIFVSSPMLNLEEGKEYQERVSKVTHGSSVRVFNNSQFSKLLSSAVNKGFEAVYKLTNFCTFRVSFVKGWGRSYKRQTILNTPCWVEVQLNGPLLWIDKVLRQMKPPQGCGSTS